MAETVGDHLSSYHLVSYLGWQPWPEITEKEIAIITQRVNLDGSVGCVSDGLVWCVPDGLVWWSRWFSLMFSNGSVWCFPDDELWFPDSSVWCVPDAIQDGWHYVKVENWPKLSGVWFWFQVSMLILWVIIAVLLFLVLVEIQDGWHVKVEDWPKFSGVQFWLQVSMLTLSVIIAIFVISGKGWNIKWPTSCYSWKLTQTVGFSFGCKSLCLLCETRKIYLIVFIVVKKHVSFHIFSNSFSLASLGITSSFKPYCLNQYIYSSTSFLYHICYKVSNKHIQAVFFN